MIRALLIAGALATLCASSAPAEDERLALDGERRQAPGNAGKRLPLCPRLAGRR
jgi:hypothetical protein